MRILLLFILFIGFCDFNAKAQSDTLVLSSGEVRLVKITDHLENGNVIFELEGQEQTLSPKDYIIFSFKNQWYEYNTEASIYSISSFSPYTIRTNFFKRPHPEGESPKWRVQFDLLPLLIETSTTNYWDAQSNWNGKFNGFYYNNRAISIDIGYQIDPKFILNIPLRFGLNPNENIIVNSENTTYSYNGFANYALPYEIEEYDGYVPTINDDYYHSWGGRKSLGHDKNLIVEGGFSTKFYPFGQVKNAFYITQGLTFGIYDHKAVDFYSEYDTTMYVSFSNDTSINWNLKDERAVPRKNQFSNFRYEFGAGMDFNITRNLGINIELTFTTHPVNTGSELDNYYFKETGKDYVLVQQKSFAEPNKIDFSYIGRFQLFYKF